MANDLALIEEFRRIREGHHDATRRTIARGAIPGSVSRVFVSGSRAKAVDVLESLPVDALIELDNASFDDWFAELLPAVASSIQTRSKSGKPRRATPGLMWGHPAKVLCIYLRDLVSFSRYFNEADARRAEFLLYCPIDGYVLEQIRELGIDPRADRILDVDSRAKFMAIQNQLAAAAREAKVPRVWFDDVSIARPLPDQPPSRTA